MSGFRVVVMGEINSMVSVNSVHILVFSVSEVAPTPTPRPLPGSYAPAAIVPGFISWWSSPIQRGSNYMCLEEGSEPWKSVFIVVINPLPLLRQRAVRCSVWKRHKKSRWKTIPSQAISIETTKEGIYKWTNGQSNEKKKTKTNNNKHTKTNLVKSLCVWLVCFLFRPSIMQLERKRWTEERKSPAVYATLPFLD